MTTSESYLFLTVVNSLANARGRVSVGWVLATLTADVLRVLRRWSLLDTGIDQMEASTASAVDARSEHAYWWSNCVGLPVDYSYRVSWATGYRKLIIF